ncbi:MAG: tetratricopeptide repeat protein [Chlorobium sp.]|nr:MAG: tetratricopeptide repeat protein [Chlorobium sp.]
MINDPYLFFAEVSLDISRRQFQAAIDKLTLCGEHFTDSYLFHLLYAKALRGLNNFSLASDYLRKCCAIAPANQVAWMELVELQASGNTETQGISQSSVFDSVTDELEQLTAALMNFEPVKTSENADPTPILEQKQPFSDDTTIAVPTESLANLFTAQGAFKKAIKIYTILIQLKPHNAEHYQQEIDSLLDRL